MLFGYYLCYVRTLDTLEHSKNLVHISIVREKATDDGCCPHPTVSVPHTHTHTHIYIYIYEGSSKSFPTFIFSRETVRAGGVVIGRV